MAWWLYIYTSEQVAIPDSRLLRALGTIPLLSHHEYGFIAAFAIAAILCGGIAEGVYQNRPWATYGAIAGALITGAAVWLLRALAVRLEDPRYVKKSAYVHVATSGAIVMTAFVAAILVLAVFLTVRRPRRDPPSTHP
ncbi:MAG TPA: hypothetical protein VGM88_17580 [Kofleriaceae bacterium]